MYVQYSFNSRAQVQIDRRVAIMLVTWVGTKFSLKFHKARRILTISGWYPWLEYVVVCRFEWRNRTTGQSFISILVSVVVDLWRLWQFFMRFAELLIVKMCLMIRRVSCYCRLKWKGLLYSFFIERIVVLWFCSIVMFREIFRFSLRLTHLTKYCYLNTRISFFY